MTDPATTIESQDVQQMQTVHGLIAEAQGFLRQAVACHYEVGVRLSQIREQTPHGQWAEILQRDFAGMPRSTAANYIAFATKCSQLPKLRDFAAKNFSAALELLHGMEPDELQALEDDSHPDLALEDLDKMSVRQLKAELRKHRHDSDQVVKEETRTLESERDALIEERDNLQAQLGQSNTPETITKHVRSLLASSQRLAEQCEALTNMDPSALTLRHKASIEANLNTASNLIATTYEDWLARVPTVTQSTGDSE